MSANTVCLNCGPFSTRRIYDHPWAVDEGWSWTFGCATVDERFCETCGLVHRRDLLGYTPERPL